MVAKRVEKTFEKIPLGKRANTRKCEKLKKFDEIREYLRKYEIM